ncbi:hypothetical protein ACMX25_30795 [Caballeronia sp. 15715]|uniref:hypothetical protein n=1 Tax=Caballeronia sp. 15715 TaxID=3391030 RepID=UPI0039E313A0
MHVIEALSSDFYEVDFGGKQASRSDVFPAWNEHDRFAIIVYEPLGAIGATHLIQLACTCFYDVKPMRRTERKIYPEIFAIHVGDWWGALGNMDFWPARREVKVSNDHTEILAAINDRGITRLAIPERPIRDIQHRRKEEDCALDGLVSSIMYNPSGRVGDAEFTIKSNDRRTEREVEKCLQAKELSQQSIASLNTSGALAKERDTDFNPRQAELNVNVTEEKRVLVRAQRNELRKHGSITESYRFSLPADALKRL